MEKILRVTEATVVVDEAYFEFFGETVVPMLKNYPRLSVMRTMSKAYAIAGLRLGYMFSSPEYARRLCSVRMPFNINLFTQLAALRVLERQDILDEAVDRVKGEIAYLQEGLSRIAGVKVFPSVTNFLLFKVDRDSSEVHRLLEDRGILVRMLPDLPGYLRVAAGTRQQNAAFLGELAAIMEKPSMKKPS